MTKKEMKKKFNKKNKFTKNKKNVTLKIKEVMPNIKNPRKGNYDKNDLEELKLSLEALGQINPIKIDEDGIILAGHRRHQAAKELGWKTIQVDIIIGLSGFRKSALMISDNSTQRQFNAWDNRASINDIYWNEFCEEYEFKGANDKGYSEFSKQLGISKSQVKVIIDSMSDKNLDIVTKFKANNIGTEVLDTVLRSPDKYRKELAAKAIILCKGKKNGGTGGLREHLRMFKKSLQIKHHTKEQVHPGFYKTIHYKISAIGLALSKDIIKSMDVNERLKLKKAIEKNILKAYKMVK